MDFRSSLADYPAFVIHDGTTISYANREAVSLFYAASREELIGSSVSMFVAATDQAPLQDQFDRIKEGDATTLGLAVDLVPEAPDVARVVVLSTAVSWDGEDMIQSVFIETDAPLPTGLPAAAMDAAPVGISIADATAPDQPLIYVNDEFVELTGYPREEVLGQNCRFLQGEQTREEPVTKMREAVINNEPVTVELRNYRKDGGMFWNRVSIVPIRSDDGSVQYFLGYQKDISARKAAEQAKSLFETQADAIDQSIIVTDTDGTIQYVNPYFEQETGYVASEAIGRTPRILKSGEHDDAVYEDLWETITAGDIWKGELINKRKSGERYRVKQKIVPVEDAEGEISHFVGIEENITDETFIEEVLDVMNRVLRHNVRNSVQAIQGNVDFLETGDDSPDREAAFRVIRSQTAKLEKLSERSSQIRDLFQRRTAHHELPLGTIRDLIDDHRSRFPDADIVCEIGIDEDVTIEDGSLLHLALDEAIENAVIHNDSEPPSVTVTVESDPETGEVIIEISDNGPGISDQEWSVIESGQETPLMHGTGIGLWLMYWTITALGGTMDKSPKDPRGSIITFAVPIGRDSRSESLDAA